jgi:hypothetical protein
VPSTLTLRHFRDLVWLLLLSASCREPASYAREAVNRGASVALTDAHTATPARIDAGEKVEGQDWPPLSPGVWEMTTAIAIGDRPTKKATEKSRSCADPSWLFAGYWGPGIVEKGGCQFSSWRISAVEYRIASECVVRHVGVARLSGNIVLDGHDAFQMKAELIEGKKHIHITQAGRRLAGCNQ